jgi:hypothetical protein
MSIFNATLQTNEVTVALPIPCHAQPDARVQFDEWLGETQHGGVIDNPTCAPHGQACGYKFQAADGAPYPLVPCCSGLSCQCAADVCSCANPTA